VHLGYLYRLYETPPAAKSGGSADEKPLCLMEQRRTGRCPQNQVLTLQRCTAQDVKSRNGEDAMTTLKRSTMLSAAFCGVLLSTCLPAHGQFVHGTNSEYVLQAHLTGKTAAEGKVQFRMKAMEYWDFGLHIVNADPGEVMVIVLRREKEATKFAWVRADKNGSANLLLTSLTNRIPVLQKKDVIEIWSEKKGLTMLGEMY
jgi:hypothetical protein